MLPDQNVYNCIICETPLSEWHVENKLPCCSKDCFGMMKFHRQRRNDWSKSRRGGFGAHSRSGELRKCVCCERTFVSRNTRHLTCSPTCSELHKHGQTIYS